MAISGEGSYGGDRRGGQWGLTTMMLYSALLLTHTPIVTAVRAVSLLVADPVVAADPLEAEFDKLVDAVMKLVHRMQYYAGRIDWVKVAAITILVVPVGMFLWKMFTYTPLWKSIVREFRLRDSSPPNTSGRVPEARGPARSSFDIDAALEGGPLRKTEDGASLALHPHLESISISKSF